MRLLEALALESQSLSGPMQHFWLYRAEAQPCCLSFGFMMTRRVWQVQDFRVRVSLHEFPSVYRQGTELIQRLQTWSSSHINAVERDNNYSPSISTPTLSIIP